MAANKTMAQVKADIEKLRQKQVKANFAQAKKDERALKNSNFSSYNPPPKNVKQFDKSILNFVKKGR